MEYDGGSIILWSYFAYLSLDGTEILLKQINLKICQNII